MLRFFTLLISILIIISIFSLILTLTSVTSSSSIEHPTKHLVATNMRALPPSLGNSSLAGKYSEQGVNPYLSYRFEPAPMGIADYGLSPNGPFIRETTQFLGVININSLDAYAAKLDSNNVSFQLNVVLNYQYDGNTYALWTQDVADYNTVNNNICFIDNIWNFSAVNANVNGVSGNGHIASCDGIDFYYDCATGYPGNDVSLSLPTTFYLLINVTTNSIGQPVICFWYDDGHGWVNYDKVTVDNVKYASNVYFLIDGYQYTGNGLYYDAELDMVGPGDGSCAYIYQSSVYLQLEYFNGHNFQGIRNAYDFGSDTGETSNNVIPSPYYNVLRGTLLSGLTAGSGRLGELWNQNSVSTLKINANVQNGYMIVYNSSYSYPYVSQNKDYFEFPFYNGEAELTLIPMNYSILVYNLQGELVGEANVNTQEGETISTNTTQFQVTVNPSSLSLAQGESSSINVNLNAYGYVHINVISPSGITYSISENPIYVNGQDSDTITVTGLTRGVYTMIINASLLPGFYITKTVTITVSTSNISYIPFEFTYYVNGSSLPQSPNVTFDFPNGSTITIPYSNNTILYVPYGTTYSIQSSISLSNGIRWAMPNSISGTVTESTTVYTTYYEQYLVTFDFTVENGQWSSSPTVTYYSFGSKVVTTPPATVWVDYNSPYYYSQILPNSNSEERAYAPNPLGSVTSPGSITVNYYIQYYVTVSSSIPVYALVNGDNTTFISNWYNGGTSISVENITYYPSSTEREVISSITPTSSFTVSSSLTVNIGTITQYYVAVSSPIPVYALVNGANETFTSNWYNKGVKISVENITYYPSSTEREVITLISPQLFTVNSALSVKVSTITQYYVNISSPIPVYALVNGANQTLVSNWYNGGTSISVENITYYPSSTEREVITSISTQSFTVNSPKDVEIKTITQYYVAVSSPIPVKASVNSKLTYLNSSWLNVSTKIEIINYTYQINSYERCVITNTSVPLHFSLNNATVIKIGTEKQYLTVINGVSSWNKPGTAIRLNASVPFYEVGEFKGTYNVPVGSVITVNGYVNETLVESPNFLVIGLIAGIIIIVIIVVAVVVIFIMKKEK
ncbi:thermopsin [Acidianus manzaensis]|uniref:Thermopsin n=1 Tax=Acidianus manzaensis TaxID=282676 RepID=A0A1W6K309_9CREN|nr:thermopsin [Acidianus manzaensis]ARM76923.1 hypothetical protein B6F84_13445 [Acidianus manzaensis]